MNERFFGIWDCLQQVPFLRRLLLEVMFHGLSTFFSGMAREQKFRSHHFLFFRPFLLVSKYLSLEKGKHCTSKGMFRDHRPPFIGSRCPATTSNDPCNLFSRATPKTTNSPSWQSTSKITPMVGLHPKRQNGEYSPKTSHKSLLPDSPKPFESSCASKCLQGPWGCP